MLPIQALLNPASPHGSSSCSLQADSIMMDSQLKKPAAPRNAARPVKSRTHGPVRFPPFEQVDAGAMREVAKFQISQFGQIYQYSQHIPYNSTKRNFYEKTGRESIEAFGYEFRIPGQQAPYKVMWDYNIGLVRMTPFFKCLGYPKVSMLDKNPGLREVSPSITGGSVGAQGYWVPYRCARALCATFCYDIAGALIPLFGPAFPSECTPPESPYFGDMVIGQHLVAASKMEAEACRNAHEARKGSTAGASTGSRWPEGGSVVLPRPPLREECGTPWFPPPPRSSVTAATTMPVIDWNSLAPYTGASSRAPSSALRHRDSDNKLPPLNFASPVQYFHRPGVLAAPTATAKRRWPYQDYSEDTARAKSARPASDAKGEIEGKAKRADEGGDDYAAAAVLVELQKENQDSGALDASTVSRMTDSESKKRAW
ncbi:hypothetical protein L249_4104 [Ophiocordyceps polyrhachis-furcata BCC 54312]|uniref:HTH APSES-type domain-containing protein n=1 Tax=Ophiocordyceps polyrhachis-furcata BCC 54312 TaxID=1330021 RepID=A0A367L5Q7_9HYPO|nr:hypothetical protein L249_4104 [Ophiocordyceps polyrhachis-furcata BCC 54312]